MRRCNERLDFTCRAAPPVSATGGMSSRSKRKVSAVAADDEEEAAAPSQGAASQPAPQAEIDSETADKLASKLCRYGPPLRTDPLAPSCLFLPPFVLLALSGAFGPRTRAVLLREHLRKPIPRKELKTAVMSEYVDRKGRILNQVIDAANTKLMEVAGLKLTTTGNNAADDDLADAANGTQAGASSQAGPSQVGASQAGGGTQGGGGTQAAGAPRGAKSADLLLVNTLVDPVRAEMADGPAVHLAFVEVVLQFLHQSEGVLDEEKLFTYLAHIGLERKECLPPPAEQEKVETLVQRRLVNEAWLRRQKKPNVADEYVYVPGARAELSRNVKRADESREALLHS